MVGVRELVSPNVVECKAVAVTVEDCGHGFDPDQASRIFDSFYTTKPNGIGVGLAISRSIIEAHGGRIWAAPAENGGADIRFTLPADTGEPGEANDR